MTYYELMQRAKENRKNGTKAERMLWQRLRRFDDFRFRRQRVIKPYIVDFCCVELKLVIEIDGDSHCETVDYDRRRTKFLESEGYRVVRFNNLDVILRCDEIAQVIFEIAVERAKELGIERLAPPSASDPLFYSPPLTAPLVGES